MEKTRERSKNFKDSEITLLLDLVKDKKSILECRKTDQVSHKHKELAWEGIATEFKNSSGIFYRDAKILKNKYENLKKTTKRKFADEKSYVMGTGGGPFHNTVITETDVKVKDIIGDLPVFGTESQFDSDAVMNTDVSEFDITDINIASLPVIYEEASEEQLLADTPSRAKQQSVNRFGGRVGLGLSRPTSGELESVMDKPTSSGTFSIQNSPKKQMPEDKASEMGSITIQPFNMRDLRNKTSSPLRISRKRKNTLDTSVAGSKIEAVSMAKKEVIELQKELYLKQIQFLEEEHKEKMNFIKQENKKKLDLLDLKLEESQLKIALLKKT